MLFVSILIHFEISQLMLNNAIFYLFKWCVWIDEMFKHVKTRCTHLSNANRKWRLFTLINRIKIIDVILCSLAIKSLIYVKNLDDCILIILKMKTIWKINANIQMKYNRDVEKHVVDQNWPKRPNRYKPIFCFFLSRIWNC